MALKAGVLVVAVELMCNWYLKPGVNIGWNNSCLPFLKILNGILQASNLSLALFNKLVNIFIIRLHELCACSSINGS